MLHQAANILIGENPRKNLRNRQQGVFMVEFALVASILALFLMFLSDIVVKENTLGHLQRLSYSGVNIIKERTQLYGRSEKATNTQFYQLFTLLKNSMKRNMSEFESDKFNMHLEQELLNCNGSGVCVQVSQSPLFSDGGCTPEKSLRDKKRELYFKTSRGRPPALYQVTLCYEGQNWYGDLIGKDFSKLRATSVMMGR